MAKTAEKIIRRIVAAFEKRELSEGDPVFISHSVEVDARTIERLTRQTTWMDFPQGVLRDNPIALAFMTPEAFAFLLPAYLVLSVAQYSESDTLTSSLLTNLTPPDEADAHVFEALVKDMQALGADLVEEAPTDSLGADDELFELFMARAAVLTRDEKAAVRDYLEYIDAVHGEDFPAFGPKQALNRYWAGAGRSEEGDS